MTVYYFICDRGMVQIIVWTLISFVYIFSNHLYSTERLISTQCLDAVNQFWVKGSVKIRNTLKAHYWRWCYQHRGYLGILYESGHIFDGTLGSQKFRVATTGGKIDCAIVNTALEVRSGEATGGSKIIERTCGQF